MPIEIEMPKLSDTMTEGTLVRWIKKVGDNVEVGDVLAEVETDKATMEMEAFDEGVLAEIYVQKGDLLRQLQAQRRLREEIVFPKNAFDGAPVSVPRDLQFIPAKINI